MKRIKGNMSRKYRLAISAGGLLCGAAVLALSWLGDTASSSAIGVLAMLVMAGLSLTGAFMINAVMRELEGEKAHAALLMIKRSALVFSFFVACYVTTGVGYTLTTRSFEQAA